MGGAENESSERWTFGIRLIADQIPRASLRTTLAYRFHPTFSAGIEYNPRAGDVRPLANWLLLPERSTRPALMLGTSSDRIGTPSGQSFYATLSKHLQRETKLPIAPYVGVVYGTHEHRWRPIGGLHVSFSTKLDSLVIFDGVHVHPTLNLSHKRHVFSLLMVRGRDPGVSYTVSF